MKSSWGSHHDSGFYIENWETIVYFKGLIRKLKKLNTKRTNNLINQWANEVNRQFSKGERQVANIHEEMFSIFSHKGYVNQNDTKNSSHPSQKGHN
jgi:hypothetical protein